MIKYLFLLLSLTNLTYSSQSELQLRTDLMTSYNKEVLPRKNTSRPIYLKLGIAIRAFESINQVEGTVDSNIWLRYWWKDRLLSWNPQDYGNTTNIKMYTDPDMDNSIWVPDIYLYNTAEAPMSDLDYSKAILYSDGSITWSRPGMIKSTCVFDLTYFPYDQQVCQLKFGSWVYNQNELNLKKGNPSIDITNMQRNGGWTLINHTSELNIVRYACCPEEYADITYNFTLRRKPGYYNLNIILPTFATAVLMLISFIVPWDSGERISFATTVMLSIIVFLLILSDSLPKTDTKPLLSQMLIGLTFFSLFVVFFTVLISSMYSYKENKNNIFYRFMKYCKCFLCKQPENENEEKNKSLKDNVYMSMLERSIAYGENKKIVDVDNILNKEEDYSQYKNEKSTDLIDDVCEKTANKLEFILTIIFIMAFIIFSIVVFSSIPSYENIIEEINI